jgi:hypothetical protein
MYARDRDKNIIYSTKQMIALVAISFSDSMIGWCDWWFWMGIGWFSSLYKAVKISRERPLVSFVFRRVSFTPSLFLLLN